MSTGWSLLSSFSVLEGFQIWIISKIFSLRAYLCVFASFVCFPPLLNSSMPPGYTVCMCVRGGRMLEKGRVASDSHLSIYIVFFTHACMRYSPSSSHHGVELRRRKKMLWPIKTQNLRGVTWKVFKRFNALPLKVTVLLWDDRFKRKLKSIEPLSPVVLDLECDWLNIHWVSLIRLALPWSPLPWFICSWLEG